MVAKTTNVFSRHSHSATKQQDLQVSRAKPSHAAKRFKIVCFDLA